MITGLVVCLWWSLRPHPPFGVDAIFPGVAASILVFVAAGARTVKAA
jgi:hypothetical protein